MATSQRDLRVSLDAVNPGLEVRVQDSHSHGWQQVRVTNISRQGLFLTREYGANLMTLPRGSNVHFSMRLGDGQEVQGVAAVRWARSESQGPYRPAGVGLHVLEFRGASEHGYMEFLEERLLDIKASDVMQLEVAQLAPAVPLRKVHEALQQSVSGLVLVVDKQSGDDQRVKAISKDELFDYLTGPEAWDQPLPNDLPDAAVVHVDERLDDVLHRLQTTGGSVAVTDGTTLVGAIHERDCLAYWRELMELQCRRLDRVYQDAISVIAHDLRTPLCVIQTTNSLLSSGSVDTMEYIDSGFPDVLDKNCRTMLKLIDDLLDVGRVRAGAVSLNRVPVDLEDLIDKVIGNFVPTAQSKQIGLEIDIPIAVPRVKVDPLRLEQVLNNLVGNALKFSPNGANVVIGLKPMHSKVALWVADNGPGIAQADLDRIFERYARAKSEKPGSGLGLAIAKRLVEAHDGTIRVDSHPGQGTTFTVLLPIGDIQ